MLAELTQEELAAALDRLSLDLLVAAGVDRPPVDAVALAQSLGIAVVLDAGQQARARYTRLKGHGGSRARPTISLRPDPRAERQQWAVAHEIGESAAYRVFAALGIDPQEVVPRAREAVACQLAGRLLLPTEWFLAEAAACRWDLLDLKRRFGTASHELIARRMLECPPPVIITIFDHRQISFRRSNVPGRVPPPSVPEMRCWRSVHAHKRPAQISAGPQAVQGWPIHEEGWKREILRTEVPEYADG